tara:strand:- start:7050 stop:7883 length:834 start_codon:yes stop_codon:yes gene_type:complete
VNDSISLPNYNNIQGLLDAHLAQLQQRFGMSMWMITRLQGEELLILRVRDGTYGLHQGHRLEWQTSYCVRMVELGNARVVADTALNPIYQDAPINANLSIGAYIGLPLLDAQQQLFGTLCALDPEPQPEALANAQEALEHEAALISHLLNSAVRDARQQRLTTFIEHPDRCDLTGLPGPKGWNDILQQELGNTRDLGMQSSVLQLQGPEEADSEIIADSLAALLREQDSVAHLGDNRFAILLADTDHRNAQRAADRIRDALNAKQLLVRLQHRALTA